MTIAQLPIYIMLITPIAVVLFVLGILVAAGKADRWIAGYNTASEEDRAKVNIKRVRWISAIILWISDIYLVFLAIANLSAIGIIITTLAFIAVCIIFTILAATSTKKVQWKNTGGLKQKHKNRSPSAKNQSSEIRLSENANKKRPECVMRGGIQ